VDRVRGFPQMGKYDLFSALKYPDDEIGKKITLALELWQFFNYYRIKHIHIRLFLFPVSP